MTGPAIQKPDPLAFLYKNLPEGTKALDPQKPDPLAFLYDKKKVGDQPGSDQVGFLDYVRSVSKNWFKVAAVSKRLRPYDPGKDPQFTDPDMIKIRNAIRQAQKTGSGADIVAHDLDFVNFFGKFMENGKEQIEKIASAPGAAAEEFKRNPIDFIGQLGKSFVTPIVDFAELSYGVSLTGDDVRALTPEQKAERIKSVVATVAMVATGIGAAKVLGLTGDAVKAVDASRLAAKGALAQRLMKSTAVAGASGAAYSLTRYANEADQLSETIINGVMFAPLGIAHELLFGETPKSKKISPAQEGAKVSQTRQVSDVLGKSFQGITQQIDAFTHANDVAEAVLTGKLHTLDTKAIIVQGVNVDRLGPLSTKLPDTWRDAVHMNTDGTGDFLVHDGSVEDEKFFEKHGFIKGQTVLHGGTEWKVLDASKENLELENLHDPKQVVAIPKENVRHPSDLALTPKIASDQLFSEWRTSTIQPRTSPLDALQEERSQLLASQDPNKDVRLHTIEDQIARLADKTRNDSPIGFDETPPEDILDNVPSTDVSKHISAFLESKGFTGDTRAALERNFHDRLAREVYGKHLSDEDRALVDKARQERVEHLKTAMPKLDSDHLLSLAKSNNMTISDGGTGRVIVRDLKTHRILGGFDNNDDAATFINKSGQANGVNLDQPNSISGSAASGGNGLPPSGAPPQANDFPYNFFSALRSGRLLTASEYLIRGLDNSALATRHREWFINVDSKFDTRIHARVMEPTQKTSNVRSNKMKPYVEKLTAVEKIIGKMPSTDQETISKWMQTMTPSEVISSFMTRPMNPLEQSMAREVAESGVDVERIFKYNREIDALDKEFPVDERQDPKKLQEYNINMLRARDAFGMDANHLAKADLFKQVEKLSKAEASLGAIVRLARSLQDKEVSRSEFATKNKMTFDQIAAGQKLDGLYSELAEVFGIPKEHRLGGYMTHARLYNDGNLTRALQQFTGDVRARDFYAKLARTGEISAFEMNPIRAMQRYIKAGFDVNSGFEDTIARAHIALEEEVKKLPAKAQQHVMNVGNRYLNDIRGYPDAGDQFAQAGVDHVSDQFNLKTDPQVRKQWVNGITAIVPAATQGLRLMAGITHFTSAVAISISDRDFAYTTRMLKAGAHARLHPEILDEVRAQGALSTVSPLTTYTEAEFQSAVGKGVRAVADVGFKLSGLPDVYAMLSGGHYITTKADALSAITRFGRKEIQWSRVKKELYLDKHYAPVQKQFELLVKAGKPEEAASYLAIQTVNELVGVFGNANHPHMWGTNWGRLVGEFGQWPTWLRSTVTRGASRGTLAQRAAFVTKLSALSWLGVKGAQSVGVDIRRFDIIKESTPLAWFGGPLFSIADDIHNALSGSGYTQDSARRRLQKMLPINPRTGAPQLEQLYIPFSSAAHSMMQAVQDFQRGNTVRGGFELAGFRRATPKQ